MDIKDYLNSLTAQQFEEICVELLRYMKPNTYKIVGTRYVKDGGKDIVGTVDDVPYEIWAECKKHTRTLGLEDISKNVILVISQEINELFFFSTSNISKHAQKHISVVAAKHGLKIAFFYGEYLVKELANLPRFKDNTVIYEPSKDLIVSYYVSKYESSDKYEVQKTIVLRRDTFFYIDIFLKNHSNNNYSDITFSWKESNQIELTIKEIDNHIALSPYNDRVIQIKGETLNFKSKHRIPTINISYKDQSIAKRISINVGIIDPTELIYFPIIGEKPNKFLMGKIRPLLQESTLKDSYCIDIRGGSGNGKSRLLKEIKNIGIKSEKHVICFDAKKNNDFTIIKELLCSLLYIPYNKGNIEVSSKNISNILSKRGADSSFADAIFSFLFKNELSEDNIYFVKQALLNFLINPPFDKKTVLLFDNIQNLSVDMIDMLIFFIDNLLKNESNCIICCSTNTEIIPLRNQEKIEAFFDFMECLPDDYHIFYPCKEMTYNDAKSLYIHALGTENEFFIDKLIKKSGCRPFDIIMLIKYMQEEKIITWQGEYAWYVTSFKKMDEFLNTVPEESQRVIKSRVSVQQKNMGINYWKIFKTIIKSLIYFQGFTPIEFFEYIGIEDDDLARVNNSFFIKYDDDLPIITFFHDNIHNFFLDCRTYSIDIKLAREINSWLNNNYTFPLTNRDSILYKTYIGMSKFELAKEYGIKTIKNNYINKNFYECVNIGMQIINNKHIIISKQEKFEILYLIANSDRERIDHQAGAQLFFDAYQFLLDNKDDIKLSDTQYNQFMHACVNSQINASYPGKALDILETFKQSKTLDEYYQFIVFNRYAVAYLANGDIEKAKENAKDALKIAESMKNNTLKSIAYSDMAFIYFNGDENRDKVIYYFELASKEKNNCDDDLNRKAELLQQKGLCYLLEKNYSQSLYYINKSIEICEMLSNSFLNIKAMSLKCAVYSMRGEPQEAITIINKALVICEEAKSIVGKIKIYTNLSAINIVIGDNVRAREYVDIAFDLFKTSGLSSIKHKPLFYNYITIYKDLIDYDELYSIIVNYSNESILQYMDDIYNDSILNNRYGIIRNGNGVFNF